MGTRSNRLGEAVLTCTQNQCFEHRYKNMFFFFFFFFFFCVCVCVCVCVFVCVCVCFFFFFFFFRIIFSSIFTGEKICVY